MGNESKTVNVKCVSWPGALVTTAIIFARAFQPGAEPMREWSAASWAWTLLPLAVPALAWAVGSIAALTIAAVWVVFRRKG